MVGRFSKSILSVGILAIWGSTCWGDFIVPNDFKLHILSYKEMMKLPEKSRALYIRDLRLFMIDEEKKHPGSFDLVQLRKESPSIAALFWSQAEAQTQNNVQINFNVNVPGFTSFSTLEELYDGYKYLKDKYYDCTSCTQSDAEIKAALAKKKKEELDAQNNSAEAFDKYLHPIIPSSKTPSSTATTTAVTGNSSQDSGAAPKAVKVATGDKSSTPDKSTTTSAPITTSDPKPQDAVAAVQGDQASADKQMPCYIAGNRAFRSNGVCRMAFMEDENAKKLTGDCGPGKIACNEFIFGLPATCEVVNKDTHLNGNLTDKCDKDPHSQKPEDIAKQMKKWSNKQIDAWNKYRAKLTDFCTSTNKTSECSILKGRLDTIVANGGNLPFSKLICKDFNSTTGKNTYLIGHTDDLTVADPANKDLSKLTNLEYVTDATKKDKEAECSQDKECYNAVETVPDENTSVSGSVQGGKIKSQTKQNGATRDGEITVSDKGKCITKPASPAPAGVAATAAAAAPAPVKPICERGNPFCAVHEINPPGDNTPKTPVLYVDNGEGFKAASDKATLDAASKNHDKRNTEALTADLQKMEDAKDNDGADLMRWGKESSDKKPKNAVVTKLENADKITDDLSVSKSPQFIEAVKTKFGLLKSGDPGCKAGWIRIIEKPTWQGAGWTDYYACGSAKGDGKLDKIGGPPPSGAPYLKIHRDAQNGNIMRVEVGTLDTHGRPLSTDIYKDGYMEPYISIKKPAKGDHWFGRDYVASVYPNPLKDHRNNYPFLAVMKSGDTYTACRGRDPSDTFVEWKLPLKESSGVLSATDSKSNFFQISKDTSLNKDGVAMCDVSKKVAGSNDFQTSTKVEPFGYMTATAMPAAQTNGGNADTAAPAAGAPKKDQILIY